MSSGFSDRDLLVRAAFHDDDDVAGDALAQLLERLGSEAALVAWANQGSEQRLLPGLGQRTGLLAGHDELAEACATHTAQAWGLNERLCLQIAPFIDACADAGVTLLALKGMGLLGDAYPDHPTRPAGDADLFVTTAQAATAVRIARQLGWHGPELGWFWYSGGATTQAMAGPTGGSIDLHHRPGRAFRYGPRGYADIVTTATDLPDRHPLAGSALRRPHPDWQLLVVATHAANPVNTHVSHPVVDVHRLVTRGGIDATRVAALAGGQKLTLRLRAGIDEAIRVLDTPFDHDLLTPATARDQVTEQRVMEIERLLTDDAPTRALSPTRRLALTVSHDCSGRGPWARLRVAAAYIGNGRRLRRRSSQ